MQVSIDFDNCESLYASGEYITSLAGLKWETFKCAIEEKYPDLIWNPDDLRRLHHTVNRKSSTPKGYELPLDEADNIILNFLNVEWV